MFKSRKGVLGWLAMCSILMAAQSQLMYEGHLPVLKRVIEQANTPVDLGKQFTQRLVHTTNLTNLLGRLGGAPLPLDTMARTGGQTEKNLKFASAAAAGLTHPSLRGSGHDSNHPGSNRHGSNFKIGAECLADTTAYARHLDGSALVEWSLRMADATGKPSAGMLSGRFLFVGDFDECQAVRASYLANPAASGVREFRGQYCLGKYRINFPPIPREGNYYWAVCLPDSCNEDDALVISNLALGFANITLVEFESMYCHERQLPWSARAVAVFTMVGVIACLVVLGTAVDILWLRLPRRRRAELEEDLGSFDGMPQPRRGFAAIGQDETHWRNDDEPLILNGNPAAATGDASSEERPGIGVRLLVAFSVCINLEKLLSTTQPKGALSCVNGIRVISINWVVLGHTALFLTYWGDNVAAYALDALKRWSFQVIINGTFSVDSFFLLSGLLVSYHTLMELRRNAGKLNWLMFYVHRYLRLTPVYMIVLGIWVATPQYLMDGPMFPQKQGFEKDFCEKTWWGNLLYVQNLVKYANGYCFGWGWYLAVDMQFYVLSPLILAPLYFRPRLGYALVGLFMVATTVTPFVLTETRYYSPSAGHPIKGHTKPLGDQNYDLYISPYCRMGPYLVGMLMGQILYRINGRRIKLHPVVVLLGWAAAIATGLAVIYGLVDYSRGALINLHVAAAYNALARTAWGASVAWVVFSCVTGHGGPVNTFLSWRAWVPLSRLTYTVYLVHIIVLMVWEVTSRVPFYLTDMTVVLVYLATLLATYAVALVTSLMFEAPVMGLEKVIFKRDKRS